MRILVTVAPLMYREVFALAIHNRRPDIEVLVGPEASLDGQTGAFAPHLLVRNDTDGADAVADVLCRVEVLYGDHLDARVSLDGEVWEIGDIGMDDLIGIVGQTERLIPEETRAQAGTGLRATLGPLRTLR